MAGQRYTDPKKNSIASCGTQIQGWGSDYFAAPLGSSSGHMITGWLDDERPDGGTGGGST